MNENIDFEELKITKASTNKVVCNFYWTSFANKKGISGKLKIQNANYEAHTNIDCFLDFEDVAILAADCATGRIIKDLETNGKKEYMRGTPKSENYNGAPESRILSFQKSANSDTIFVNMSRGKGKLTDTGAILPDGKPDLTIGVPVKVEKFRSMFIYANQVITAYLASVVGAKVRAYEEQKKTNTNK